MTRTRFEHIHASGRYSTTVGQLTHALLSYIGDPDVALISLTEINATNREHAAHVVLEGNGWGLQTGNKGGMDDCGIGWDKTVFTKIAGGTTILSGMTVPGLGGGKTVAAWAVLETANGHRLLAITAHLPRSVEKGNGWTRAGGWTRKWAADTKALRNLWNHLAQLHHVDAIKVSCDWNVNIKRAFFRSVFKRRFPGMTLTLNPKLMPRAGTHGSRLIDFTLIRGDLTVIKRPAIMPANASSDHRPYRETLDLG